MYPWKEVSSAFFLCHHLGYSLNKHFNIAWNVHCIFRFIHNVKCWIFSIFFPSERSLQDAWEWLKPECGSVNLKKQLGTAANLKPALGIGYLVLDILKLVCFCTLVDVLEIRFGLLGLWGQNICIFSKVKLLPKLVSLRGQVSVESCWGWFWLGSYSN